MPTSIFHARRAIILIVPHPIDDLRPFFADPCWMFVLLARKSDSAVILRRGPTEWWHVTNWDTHRDTFHSGQWFRGRMYPDKCDLSPDGKLLIYFAGKHRPRDVARGYSYTWIAVSRPPYLTALALWPVGDTWGGQGIFLDDRAIRIAACGSQPHPDHPPGPLRVVEYSASPKDAVPCWQSGWQKAGGEFRKTSGDLILGREMPRDYFRPSRRPTLYTLYRPPDEPVAIFEAHWADWDQRGRLVAAVGGRILAGKLAKRNHLAWRQLADLHEEKPARLEAPEWAQHW